MTADLLVDERGRRCPLPVIELGRRILEVPVGGVVALLSDDPAAANDIPAWCGLKGHEYLGAEPLTDGSGGTYRVRRSG